MYCGITRHRQVGAVSLTRAEEKCSSVAHNLLLLAALPSRKTGAPERYPDLEAQRQKRVEGFRDNSRAVHLLDGPAKDLLRNPSPTRGVLV